MLSKIKAYFCKHGGDTTTSSCPFTGTTYIYCVKCATRIGSK